MPRTFIADRDPVSTILPTLDRVPEQYWPAQDAPREQWTALICALVNDDYPTRAERLVARAVTDLMEHAPETLR